MKIGIDLALRKIGITVLDDNDNLIDFILFDSDSKKYNNEELLIFNSVRVSGFLGKYYWQDWKEGVVQKNINIALEGLSFNSPSQQVDLIDANHWRVRCDIKASYPESNLIIKHPKSWQKNILTKDILSEWAKQWPIIRAKRGMKLTKEQQSSNNKSKAEIRKLSKQYIYDKLPKDAKDRFDKYISDNKIKSDAKFDLSDSYWIAFYGCK